VTMSDATHAPPGQPVDGPSLRVRRWVAEQLAHAPPLTIEQRSRLTALLRPDPAAIPPRTPAGSGSPTTSR
jgi:hypothetical protein